MEQSGGKLQDHHQHPFRMDGLESIPKIQFEESSGSVKFMQVQPCGMYCSLISRPNTIVQLPGSQELPHLLHQLTSYHFDC